MDVCVIGGAGHVGLPLAIALAERGKKVAIFDINEDALALINGGEMPFMEEGATPALRRVIGKTLTTTTRPDVISECHYVIIIVGTPVDEHLNPTFSRMKSFFDSTIPYLRSGQTVILRSTVYPGISAKLNAMLGEKIPGIKVCFCPERILEGKAMAELAALPQIVSGFEEEGVKDAESLFKTITKEVIRTTPLEAELAKLFTNSWRYIEFAIANQFFMIAEEYGANFYNIFKAMTFNYPRMKNIPRAGFAAGPCLLKDTMQLSAFTNNNFFLGHSAMLINEGLPNFIISKLKRTHDNLGSLVVGILGMAFKAESDDKRQSLSFKLRKLLEIEVKDVLCSDEYIREKWLVSPEEVLRKADIIIIGAPHRAYRGIDFNGKEVIDIWNTMTKQGDA